MTIPNVVNAGEKPKLLNYLLRVMTSDGHLFEIDGNKGMSIAVYSALSQTVMGCEGREVQR